MQDQNLREMKYILHVIVLANNIRPWATKYLSDVYSVCCTIRGWDKLIGTDVSL